MANLTKLQDFHTAIKTTARSKTNHGDGLS
jgi:hypothetical protein